MPDADFFRTVHLKPRSTPCAKFPERCGRREIRHVAFDADDTLWEITPHSIASSLCPPYKVINENTVEASSGSCYSPQVPRGWEEPPARRTRVTLKPGVRETLKTLKMLGISASVISLNTPGSVKGLLEALGIADEFLEIADTWDAKDKVIKRQMAKFKVSPCATVFLDDNGGHVDSVSETGALALQMGVDVKMVAEILDFIK